MPGSVHFLTSEPASCRDSRASALALSSLTVRERQVLQLVTRGYSNAAVCAELFLSPKTIEKHIQAIFIKLGLRHDGNLHRRVVAATIFLQDSMSRALEVSDVPAEAQVRCG